MRITITKEDQRFQAIFDRDPARAAGLIQGIQPTGSPAPRSPFSPATTEQRRDFDNGETEGQFLKRHGFKLAKEV